MIKLIGGVVNIGPSFAIKFVHPDVYLSITFFKNKSLSGVQRKIQVETELTQGSLLLRFNVFLVDLYMSFVIFETCLTLCDRYPGDQLSPGTKPK